MRTLAALLILVAIAASQPAHLCSLVGKALALQGDPEVPCSLEFIQPYSKDLIALSGTQGDNSDQRLGHLKDVFNDRLYLTFQDPSIDLPLSSISRRMEVPMVVTHPVYYLTPDQANLQRTLTAIRLNKPIEQLSSDEVAPLGAYFTTQAEMQRRFSGIQSALERTQEIAERCRFDLPLGVANMPKVPMPDGMTQSQYLRQKAQSGRTPGTVR